jgi:hypothetical protein
MEGVDVMDNPTALGAACDFLDHYLRNGPKPSLAVYAASDREGITRSTLRRAEQSRGVRRTRASTTGRWFMYLPPIAHVPASSRTYPIRPSITAGTRATAPVDDEDDYDIDHETDYESTRAAGSPWGWVVTIAALVCGFVLVRRWRGANGLRPVTLTAGAGITTARPTYTPPRAPRTNRIVAPYRGDDAIYGPDAPSDAIVDPFARLRAYESRFAPFPDTFDFVPDSGA